MLRLLTPAAGDILFFPTISEHDLQGLARTIDHVRRGLEATWHFLFRRNIYSGTRADYTSQDAALEDMRVAFRRVQRSVVAMRSFFYTDTEELTEQYERLGVFRFHTLPVPHTCQASDRIRNDGPLRLTYLGDARIEKGFHLIPELAERLERDYLATGRVRLALQCNYNIPGGEPRAAIARDQLETMRRGYIEFHKEPLTSEEYRKLLLSADINFLCYDAANYYARSSGILVESLAVGIPVIVPAGCWLSRQLLRSQLEYLEELCPRTTVFSIDPCRHDAAFLDVPGGVTQVLVRGVFTDGSQSTALTVTEFGFHGEALRDPRRFLLEAAGNDGKAAICVPLPPNCTRISIDVRSARASEGGLPGELTVEFLAAPEGRPFPIGAVGLIYSSTDEIPVLVKDLIDHYAHYSRTAVEFSKPWREYHNSHRLLREMEAVAGVPRNDAARCPAAKPAKALSV